ncbi:steroid receptor RNA activator 1 [Austrofundulus limnaeus]|uniref:Steroid receptor RNA activator 1 n=1 Tax=Austrofundulus limnaeus TaxID=52670 RepID=A0A2I4D7S7_AUSLI|nr:PREDICTED: steroid receptor RNA activator 1 [Austrofundulus limnaeus]
MEDMYIKPGNQERGWNDPPQFSYGLQTAHGPPKNLLNKRAVQPTTSGAGVTPSAPLCSKAPPPPICSIAPPPFLPGERVATPPSPVGPMRSQEEAASSQSEPDVCAVMLVLNRALEACRTSVKVQVCNEVAKRLRLLEDSWRTGKLSLPVQRRMDTLSQELQAGHWDSADEVHRSLMVDHVTQVSQWMVGVKRLIAETRNLSPELLRPLQNLTRPESAEPAEGSKKPDQDPVDPDQDPIDPVLSSLEPVQDPVEPVQDPVEPVQGPVDPVQNPVEPVQDPVEPVQDPVDPVQDPVE